jgi:hypothetical protein
MREQSASQPTNEPADSVKDAVNDAASNNAKDRIRRMVLLAWCRPPNDAELQRLQGFYQSTLEYYRQNPNELEALGGLKIDQAAYAQVARVLFNTDEFVNRD